MKKKAVKIAAATAVAASAFVAAAPSQSDAASSVAVQVSKAVTAMKQAYHTYSDVTATGKFADINTVYADYNAAKAAYASAKKAVEGSKDAKKDAYLAELDSTYADYIAKRVVTYIDAYNYAQENLEANRVALTAAIEAKDAVQVEKLYHEISYQLKVRTVILDRVYGETTRNLFREGTKAAAQELRDSMVNDVTVGMKLRDADAAIKAGKFEDAKKALDVVAEYLPKATTFKAELEAAAKLVVAAYDATQTVSALDVTATNLKEVTVSFSSAVSNADGKLADSFSVKNNTVAAAKLSADKKSVTLTLGTALNQQSSVEVTAKKTVKFENGKSLTEDFVKSISVTDVTIPVAESIALTGPNTFDVTFSEPVQAGDAPSVLINNGVYGIDSANTKLSTDGRTLSVKLSATTLPEGSYEVKVSGYKDFGNFAAMSKTFTLEYKKDTVAPTVKLVSAAQGEVVVEFDKAVTQKGGAALDANYFYHTYSAWKPVEVKTTDNKKFTLVYDDKNENTVDFILPEGNVTVTVLKSANDKAVVDMWGNELAADAKLAATITADKVAPTVTKVEAKSENQVVVTFSEKIDVATAKFAIKDSASKAITQAIDKVEFDADKLTATLTLSGKLSGGDYSIEIKDAVDTSLSKNKMTAVTQAFTVTDKTPVDLTAAVAKVVTNASAKEQYVYVTFNEAVALTGANSALAKENYLVGGVQLADADKVEVFGTDNKRVKITVKYRDDAAVVTAGTTVLTMGRIADAAGNFGAALSTNTTIAADTALNTFTATAIGKNKLELVFDDELKTVTADGIIVDGQDANTDKATVAAIDKVEVKSGKTYVTVTLKEDESLADKSKASLEAMTVGIVDGKLETVTGQKLSAATLAAKAVKDGIAPELEGSTPVTLRRADVNIAEITVDFDEELAALHSLAATDLVVSDATGKVLVAGVDYTVALSATDASKLVITYTAADKATLDKLNGTKFSVATKATVNYLDDAAENTIKVFEAKSTSTTLSTTVEN